MKKTGLMFVLFLTIFCTAQDKVQQIDSVLTASYTDHKLNGNVLIAEKGAILYQKSFGKANQATGQDLNAESIFELASVSKQFTAMGIMLLKKEGKLSYDDSLRKFIPELPYYNITIRQLLHHTSGLPDYMDLFMKHWDSTTIATNQDMIDLLAKYKPAILFAPGEKWEYSNTGYALLATIIEKASGKSFGDFLDAAIFQPLDMKRTMVYRRRYEKKTFDNYAYGYVFDKAKNKFVLPDSLAETASMVYCLDGIVGDGTVNSTTNDLFKWDRALYTEKLVPKEMLAEAFEPGLLKDGKKTTYGFGWAIGNMKEIGKLVNHSGGWPGYSTLIERHLDSDKTIIILRNHDGSLQLMQKLRNILYGLKEEIVKEITVSYEILKQYIGEYELASGFTITISAEQDKLYAQATGQERFQLFAEKEDLFFLKVVEAKVKFEKDEKGAVNKLNLYQGGQELPGVRIK